MAALDVFAMAASRLAATPSKSSSKRSQYTSNVIDALAWPKIRCNAFTFAPADTARDAAVCLRSCGMTLVDNPSPAITASGSTPLDP
jgi:hypothetical protein